MEHVSDEREPPRVLVLVTKNTHLVAETRHDDVMAVTSWKADYENCKMTTWGRQKRYLAAARGLLKICKEEAL